MLLNFRFVNSSSCWKMLPVVDILRMHMSLAFEVDVSLCKTMRYVDHNL